MRRFLSFVFIVSSITKMASIKAFSIEIVLYLNVYFRGFLKQWSIQIAIAVCILEFLIGVWGIIGVHKKLNKITFIVILSFFTLLTFMNLSFPSPMGRIETCGCFGELIHFTPTTSFLKSLVLWVTAVMTFVMDVSPKHKTKFQ
jgi:hypothetical protein